MDDLATRSKEIRLLKNEIQKSALPHLPPTNKLINFKITITITITSSTIITTTTTTTITIIATITITIMP